MTAPATPPSPQLSSAWSVRAEADRALFARLERDPAVQRVREALQKDEGRRGTRRHLLARALRLNATIAPKLSAVLGECMETLGVHTEVELYVHPSADYNAGVTQPEGDRVFVLVTAALMEHFDAEEMRFVLGHELGHHLYGHHAIPLQHLSSSRSGVSAEVVLTAFAWQRHAEISADRAGLLCTRALDGAARALFKLSSGLRRAPSPDQVHAFMEQAMELQRETEGLDSQVENTDWLSTHPFSPIRLRAAAAFAESAVFRANGPSLPEVEAAVGDLMALMEASYLKERTEAAEAMRRLLFTAGVMVTAAAGSSGDAERRALEALLGAGTVPRGLDLARVSATLDERVTAVRDLVPRARRGQLVRDLVLIARADGDVQAAELDLLHDLATRLDVSRRIVDLALESDPELD